MNKSRSHLLSLLTAVLITIGLAGCDTAAVDSVPTEASATTVATVEQSPGETEAAGSAPPEEPAGVEADQEKPGAAGTALAQLETITIKGRAPKTGYDRDQFGSGWLDPDRNGCDGRNDILERDFADETFRPGTQECIVLTGTLADPFTATTIEFVRGNETSTEVQIDHVVALSDAWQKGAQQLVPNQREAFANDPLNLLAVDGPTNASKGDSDAATWLPPNEAFRCEYVALQTAVKAKYELWMTQAEHDAIAAILTSTCPEQPVPDDNGGVRVPVAALPPEEPEEVESAPGEGTGITYENCTAVRDADADPIKVGDPGWDTKFDGDGDGIGCE